MDNTLSLLVNIWFFLIGLILVLYVVSDGFDLGVGILSLGARDAHQAALMSSIGSVWGANETWLVLLAGALFGAFPLAFGVILHALYIPIMFMLLGFVLRGVAFEFHEHSSRKGLWGWSFGLGSLLAALAQGMILGGLLSGLRVQDRVYVGGVWDWLTPFTLLVIVGVMCGYTLLGATWIILKTTGAVQQRSVRYARVFGWLMLLAAVGVTIWTPLKFPGIAEKWFSLPNFFLIAPLPALALFAFFMLLRALARGYERTPFAWSLLIFACSFAGLAVSLYPLIIPPDVTLLDAASSPGTLVFMLPGIGMLIPVMVVYNGYQYLVFRGKVREGGSYGED